MKRLFRKYHRAIALITAIPIFLTVVTGMAVTFIREWGINLGLTPSLLLKLHTGEVFHLEAIYPILNGVGLIGLLVTGLSMSGMFGCKPRKPIPN
jgi:hypothetical protein